MFEYLRSNLGDRDNFLVVLLIVLIQYLLRIDLVALVPILLLIVSFLNRKPPMLEVSRLGPHLSVVHRCTVGAMFQLIQAVLVDVLVVVEVAQYIAVVVDVVPDILVVVDHEGAVGFDFVLVVVQVVDDVLYLVDFEDAVG
jgi:hypothetical protein